MSALTGRVSSVAVALSIDHPDVTQLVVSLSGPDGTNILLMNRGGRPGDALREVFGRTREPLEPLSSFAGRPAAGAWRLRVLDAVPGAAPDASSRGRSSSSRRLRPADAPFPGATAVIPTSAHAIGRLGAFFTTDLRLFNTDPANPQSVS